MPPTRQLDLSHEAIDLVFSLDRGLALEGWRCPSMRAWIDRSSPLFAVTVNGRVLDARSPEASVLDAGQDRATGDASHAVMSVAYIGTGIEIDLHVVDYSGTALVETWVTLRNVGPEPARIGRIDSFALHLSPGAYDLLSFSSGWGVEFEGVRRSLDEALKLESRSGRSSKGMHPFCILSREGELMSVAVAWSGNWAIRFEPDETGYAVTGGLNDWEFFVDLSPGEEIEAPHAVVALAAGDLNEIARQHHRVGRRHWYPQNDVCSRLPLEWNHWWSYEDRAIDEETFRSNVEAAARLGFELCTLDAGWFGESGPDSAWTDYRGDWDRVNQARFPSGIRSLSDYAHARGLLFGLWCEIEALGPRARLAAQRPESEARRDGVSLGYICLGYPGARDWALATLERLAVDYDCNWIKLDFNVDPGAGCNRLDHGHGAGDGLLAHYRGYYSVLARFRSRHPEVALENCSSGGLRIDLGIMRHTHMTFLSDPDWPVHNLQVFWGATMTLAPEVCLHWGPSEWLTPHPRQTFDPHDPSLTRERVDFHIRTALLGAAGVSLRLPDLPPWVADRIALNARLYKGRIRAFVREGVLYRLTEQPRRDGGGDGWCAFQYSRTDDHLLVIFRLPGAEPQRSVFPRDLNPAALYRLEMVDDGTERRSRGDDLMREGIRVDWLYEEDSAIIVLGEEHSDT